MSALSFARLFQIFALTIFTFVYSLSAVHAEPQIVTGFTKIVDGSDLVPGDAPNTFYDGYFIPTPGSGVQLVFSHDGITTAFLGCSSNI